ncbi:hypothetical protein [Candidatus Puniceispirillum marinum]|uniref:DNA double-strand break repair rad50 ATPase n=1 Tax=Puniceispirillum marinum (strain IMCC1322) TaxID=488538 RepID=D5BTC4_PUNMI|nr:hypothetical protein [Candidatus Puniceispirillum marinum]ADE39521.1 DNA double-strand break repair rad50 ATPase [Candidatus Puniceispirillum marinum IMCC1322]
MNPKHDAFLNVILKTQVKIEFESDPVITGSSEVKDVAPLSKDALKSLQEFVSFCKDSELLCRPSLPSCFIDGIYQKNGVYFEVDCVWSDAKENNCITVIRVSKEYAEQKSTEVEKTNEVLSEYDFINSITAHDIYPPDYPQNYFDVELNESFKAIYKRPEDKEDLNPLGNFHRRKSIHNDILRTIERMKSEKIDFRNFEDFQSDHFKVEVMVKARSTED